MDINVVAIFKARAGKEQELEKTLQSLVAPTHAEPGCKVYGVSRAKSDNGTFVFIEKWASEADLAKHLETPHVAAAFKRKDELIDSMHILPLTSISEGKKLF